MSAHETDSDERPPCMVVLNLLPPYSAEDVKASYRERALQAHPDHGGDRIEFQKLHQAYEDALQYVEVRGDLRRWIAVRVETHLRQEEVAEEVARRHGRVEVESFDWLKRSLGDGFAQLEERLRRICVRGPHGDDELLRFLAERRAGTAFLIDLDLAHGRVTDAGLPALAGFQTLQTLDLEGAKISGRGLRALLPALPALKWVNVAGTGIYFWTLWLLRWSFPQIEFVKIASPPESD